MNIAIKAQKVEAAYDMMAMLDRGMMGNPAYDYLVIMEEVRREYLAYTRRAVLIIGYSSYTR